MQRRRNEFPNRKAAATCELYEATMSYLFNSGCIQPTYPWCPSECLFCLYGQYGDNKSMTKRWIFKLHAGWEQKLRRVFGIPEWAPLSVGCRFIWVFVWSWSIFEEVIFYTWIHTFIKQDMPYFDASYNIFYTKICSALMNFFTSLS